MSFSHRIFWTIDCKISHYSHTPLECLIRIQKHFTIQKDTFIEVEFDCHASQMSDLQLFLLSLTNGRSVGENVVPGLLEARIIIHNSELDLKQTLLNQMHNLQLFFLFNKTFYYCGQKEIRFLGFYDSKISFTFVILVYGTVIAFLTQLLLILLAFFLTRIFRISCSKSRPQF